MKNISKNTSLLLTLILFVSFSAFKLAGRKIAADKANSSISYSMTHPMHDWEGVSKDVNCVIVYNDETKQIEQVAAALKVDSFDSGNSNRDSHAIEAMEGLKFPKVSFSSSNVKQDGANITAIGNLTFHGIAKPITIKGTAKETGGKLVIDADFNFQLTDFKVERPSLFGVKTDDLVKMKLKVVFGLK